VTIARHPSKQVTRQTLTQTSINVPAGILTHGRNVQTLQKPDEIIRGPNSMQPVATFGEDLDLIHLWYCVLSKYQLTSSTARQQRATLTPQSPTLKNTHVPSKYRKLHLTFTLKENSLRKHTVLQMDRINYYTPASFLDVGKKFLRFHRPLFALFVTNHVAGHSVTESALAYQATELRVASNIALLSETANAASYRSVCNQLKAYNFFSYRSIQSVSCANLQYPLHNKYGRTPLTWINRDGEPSHMQKIRIIGVFF
jgi:hypothetical protein